MSSSCPLNNIPNLWNGYRASTPVSSLPPLHARLCPSICPSHTPCLLSSAFLGCSPPPPCMWTVAWPPTLLEHLTMFHHCLSLTMFHLHWWAPPRCETSWTHLDSLLPPLFCFVPSQVLLLCSHKADTVVFAGFYCQCLVVSCWTSLHAIPQWEFIAHYFVRFNSSCYWSNSSLELLVVQSSCSHVAW
jgi:hypothetical protein